MATKRVTADWERIEADFRVGIKTLREIAGEHGITEGAIRKKAKQNGWERDLAEKVRAKAEELVRKSEVRKAVRKNSATEKETVDVNATSTANVAIRHREDLVALRDAAMAMLAELMANGEHSDMLKKLADMLANTTESETDRNQAYKMLATAAGVQSRIGSMKALAETITKLVDAERVAWKLDKGPEQQTRDLSDLEVASKLAHFVDLGRRRAAGPQQPIPFQSPASPVMQ